VLAVNDGRLDLLGEQREVFDAGKLAVERLGNAVVVGLLGGGDDGLDILDASLDVVEALSLDGALEEADDEAKRVRARHLEWLIDQLVCRDNSGSSEVTLHFL